MTDHSCMNNAMWRDSIGYVEQQPRVVTNDGTQPQDCLGFDAWDLSIILVNFLCYWVSDKIYMKRTYHSGGEAAIGFEMLRSLFKTYHGGIDNVKLAGINALNTFPKCSSVTNLGGQLDSWQELCDEFGNNLGTDPRQRSPSCERHCQTPPSKTSWIIRR